MIWQRRWGKLRTFLESRQEAGLDTPALETEPEETQDMGEFISAFSILTRGRSLGFAIGPIPLAEIDAYIRLFGEPAFGRDVFVSIIGQMDSAYLDEVNSSNATNPTRSSPRSTNRHKGR